MSDITKLVSNSQSALEKFMLLSQNEIDDIVHAMTVAALHNHMHLSHMAIDETKRGVFEDKVIKNMYAAEYVTNSLKNVKTVGVIENNEQAGYMEIAEPVGIVACVTPVTNPTSTTIFKALINMKARNPVIFAFHPSAQKCSAEAARILYNAAVEAGAPEYCIQWIDEPSIEMTNALMNNPNVAVILATGGTSMVRAAYSSGKPALGVGPGNVPCYIEQTADIKQACNDLILSKTFDNGMICASEQAAIVDAVIAEEFENEMKNNNCYFLNTDEIEKLTAFVMNAEKKSVNAQVVGMSASWIAEQAQIIVPAQTKILLARLPKPSMDNLLSLEKLSPVLAYFVVEDSTQGFSFAKKMLELGGMGHSAVIHSNNIELCNEYGKEMQVGRVIVNAPSSHGAIGDLYNTNMPSLTLGCGSYGRNSTTANVSAVNLINKKRVAYRRVNMQWFKVPPKIYFEHGSIQYLESMPDISRAFIVTDKIMEKMGYVEKVTRYLEKRCAVHVYTDVEPDPNVETIMNGVKRMESFEPDVIIALGGGSAIDAAKGMWLFYEYPETNFEGISMKFMDIRKRTYAFPKLGSKAKLVAIPTTSGTGAEVTAFSVITGHNSIKYPLADYELTPNVAIIDPQFTMSMPKSVIADTGLDVLTHAIEAYVSVLASDYTDGLAMKAIELVFKYLVRSYNGDAYAREKMHNASTIAGMAFTNAFLGLNHSMAHKLGGEYHIPHGRANAILLPHIIEYNSQPPTKFVAWPKYTKFIADKRYAEIAKYLCLPCETTTMGVESLIGEVRKLMREVNIPLSLSECGVDREIFFANVKALAENAFADQCTTANPRYPLMSEIENIYMKSFESM